MAAINVVSCDRCGNRHHEPDNTVWQGRLTNADRRRTDIAFDICDECWQALAVKGRPTPRRGRPETPGRSSSRNGSAALVPEQPGWRERLAALAHPESREEADWRAEYTRGMVMWAGGRVTEAA